MTKRGLASISGISIRLWKEDQQLPQTEKLHLWPIYDDLVIY